jgi:hypothetical protein
MKITSAEFVKSAVWLPQYPPAKLLEIVFKNCFGVHTRDFQEL